MFFFLTKNINDTVTGFGLNLSTNEIPLNFGEGIKILIFSAIAGLIIRSVFYKYSDSLSSRKGFGNAVLMITVSVASLIAVVKSSLALSLGLVGALSVVRFRTAIKEPYNLSFLLLAICIGIAIGASQFSFALLITIIGSMIAFCLKKFSKSLNKSNMANFLDTINIEMPISTDLNKISNLLEKETETFQIKSISENEEKIFLTANISLSEKSSIEEIRTKIREINPDCIFSFYSSPL